MAWDLIPERVPILRGEGLTLREMSEEDLPAWFGRLSDPEAAVLAGDPVATSLQALIDGLHHHREALHKKEGLRWSIVPDAVGANVGSIGLIEFDPRSRSAVVGAAVGRAHWGQGIAGRAGRLVADYAFGPLALARIEAIVLARNARVIRVLDKLGFARQPGVPAGRGIGGADGESALFVLRR